jgi:hypothetical protein
MAALQVIYGRGLKRISLQRVLVAKVSFFPEKVTMNDLLVLFDNLLWCQDKCSVDPSFREKHGLYLKVLAYILKQNEVPSDICPRYVRRLSNSFLKNLSGFSWEKRNTLPTHKIYKGKYEVRASRSLGIELSKLPATNYIGVGYRDKGTAKQPWIDGSPSWQEVASSPIESLRIRKDEKVNRPRRAGRSGSKHQSRSIPLY